MIRNNAVNDATSGTTMFFFLHEPVIQSS